MKHSIAVILIASLATSAFAESWSSFRGPGGSGRSDAIGLPLTWDDSEGVAWKTALPGHGSSSPVVFGEHIYLTCFSGYGIDPDDPGERDALQQHVLCFDRSSGSLKWNRSRPASPNEQNMSRRVADHGYATATPACDETGVYASFGVSGVAAYSPDGELKWTAEIGSKTAGFGSAASPVLFDNLVIVNGSIESRTVYAFNKETGKEAWRIEDVEKAWTTPTVLTTVDGTPELVVNQKNTIFGFDPRTGKQLWHCAGIEDYVVPVVVGHDGVAFCVGGRSNRAIAVRLGGRGDVSESHVLWRVTIGANVTSPVYFDGHLYCATDKAIAWCLDAKTGNTVYRERLPTRSRVYASAIVADKRIYVTTRDQGVVVLKTGTKFEQIAQNVFRDDDGLLNATPAIDRGQILLRTNRFLYCIGG